MDTYCQECFYTWQAAGDGPTYSESQPQEWKSVTLITVSGTWPLMSQRKMSSDDDITIEMGLCHQKYIFSRLRKVSGGQNLTVGFWSWVWAPLKSFKVILRGSVAQTTDVTEATTLCAKISVL